MPDYRFKFPTISSYNVPTISSVAEVNLVEFLKWATLECGGCVNVSTSDTNPYGGANASKLRPVGDPNFADGRVWEARRADWVWESGPMTAGLPVVPQPVTSVVVNGSAVFTGFGVDYPRGRIVFNSPISLTSSVACAHTYRSVQVKKSDDPFWEQLDVLSLRADDERQQLAPGNQGDLEILSQNRVQLPAYVIEPIGNARLVPYEVGSTTSITYIDFVISCMAETPWDRKWLHDSLVVLQDHAFPTFNVTVAPPPLLNGMPVTGALTFPELVANYPWKPVYADRVSSNSFFRFGSLYMAQVRMTLRVSP